MQWMSGIYDDLCPDAPVGLELLPRIIRQATAGACECDGRLTFWYDRRAKVYICSEQCRLDPARTHRGVC